jgi:hypothetical protein
MSDNEHDSDIRISRSTQALVVLLFLGLVGAFVSAQIPEIQRYLKVRSM